MNALEVLPEEQRPSWLLSRDGEMSLRFRVGRDAQSAWAKLPVDERCRRLGLVAAAILARREEIADLIVDENGKPRVEAIGHEIASSLDVIRWTCANAPSVLREERVFLPFSPHRAPILAHQPFGLVVVISPWNFPLSIPVGQVVAALAAGNAVILKPSEHTPRIGALVGSLFEAAHLPPNLLQVVRGDGAVGAELVDARPEKVFFTGSVATGRKVMAACARFPVPVSLELGGIDALIVCEDADLELATSAALWGAFMNTGQVCASVERILVHASVRDRFVGRLVQKMERIDPDRDLGRVTMPRQGQTYERHLADAVKRGLQVLSGGKWLSEGKYAPTLVAGEHIETSDVYRDESFGPIAAIATFRDDAEAIRKHDDTPYGLTASVFTSDLDRGERIARSLSAGLVSVNDVAATLHAFGALPWGGRGESGFGRSHGAAGLLECTWPKVVDVPRRVAGMDPLGGVKRPWWFPYDADQLTMMGAFAQAVGEKTLRGKAAALARVPGPLLASLKRAPRT
jgi:acyl-CoA reductase-like NAD-dependent aldehyde dehydrogenase